LARLYKPSRFELASLTRPRNFAVGPSSNFKLGAQNDIVGLTTEGGHRPSYFSSASLPVRQVSSPYCNGRTNSVVGNENQIVGGSNRLSPFSSGGPSMGLLEVGDANRVMGGGRRLPSLFSASQASRTSEVSSARCNGTTNSKNDIVGLTMGRHGNKQAGLLDWLACLLTNQVSQQAGRSILGKQASQNEAQLAS
jgi:hypothetical protein